MLATTDDPARARDQGPRQHPHLLFSEIGDGQDHSRVSEILYPQTPDSLPLVTIGKCAGAIKTAGRAAPDRGEDIGDRSSTGPPPISTSTLARAMGAPNVDLPRTDAASCRGCST